MEKRKITLIKSQFDETIHIVDDTDVEYWLARELMPLLGYERWENFEKAIGRSMESCKTSGIAVSDHFREVTKMITLGKGGKREVKDYMLTRYACYLVAQNGDPKKEEIAFAQSYFAVQTRKQELIEERIAYIERTEARGRLRESEKRLSQNIYERGVDDAGFGRIRSKGDTALFGGHTTQDMKQRLGVKENRPLADFLPTLTIAAKNLATEMTNYNVEEKDLRGEAAITTEHVQNNSSVRSMLGERGIKPEQASGESEKTSIRIKNKMQQMMLEGLYTGGPIRFGYHLVDSGLVNRKGAKIRKYEIDPAESEVLHMIDEMTVHKGYGSYRTADFLNKNGYKPNGGGKFTSIKVNRILRDPFYCGRLEDGTTSPQLEALRLRSDDTYDQILYILEQRQNKNEEKRHIALQTRGQAMLSGNIFCAHCGGRLTTIRYRDSYTRADGTVYSVNEIKYCCYHKSRKLCQCDGQTTYRAERVDESIRQIIRKLFSGMDGAPEEEKLQAALKRQMAGNRAVQKKLDRELTKDRERLTKLQLEIGKTLTSESSYSVDDLSQAIRNIKARIEDAEIKLTQLKDEEEQDRQGIEQITPVYERFRSWAEEFDTATLEQQKMIACHLFKRIEVGRGYQIKAELNMTYKQFCSEWGRGDLLGEVIG